MVSQSGGSTPLKSKVILLTSSKFRNDARAVGEYLLFDAYFVQQREVHIGQRNSLTRNNVPATQSDLAVALADDDRRDRPVAVLVAVTHVGPIKKDRVVEQVAIAVGCFR